MALLYQDIIKDLRRKLGNGIIKKGDRIPSEAELSASYKVSRITSRRALNDLAEDGLIYRVRGSGSYATGKLPDEYGQLEGRQRVVTIAIPFDTSQGRLMDLIQGAAQRLYEEGIILNIRVGAVSPDAERLLITDVAQSNADGMILYPLTDYMNIDRLMELVIDDYPLVLIDKYYAGLNVPSIVSDNDAGAYTAVASLLAAGRRRIAFISDYELAQASSVRDRYTGWMRALVEARIPEKDRLMVIGNAVIDKSVGDLTSFTSTPGLMASSHNSLLVILKDLVMKQKIDAVFCINDSMASLVYKALKAIPVRIPTDVAVVGFDDLEYAVHMDPPLSTVRQDFARIGEHAAQKIIDRLKGQPSRSETIVVPTRFMDRGSI